jgi:hypothetical protein
MQFWPQPFETPFSLSHLKYLSCTHRLLKELNSAQGEASNLVTCQGLRSVGLGITQAMGMAHNVTLIHVLSWNQQQTTIPSPYLEHKLPSLVYVTLSDTFTKHLLNNKTDHVWIIHTAIMHAEQNHKTNWFTSNRMQTNHSYLIITEKLKTLLIKLDLSLMQSSNTKPIWKNCNLILTSSGDIPGSHQHQNFTTTCSVVSQVKRGWKHMTSPLHINFERLTQRTH